MRSPPSVSLVLAELLASGGTAVSQQPPSYWDSPAAQRYLASPAPPPAFRPPDGANLRDATAAQRFPVLGLVHGFAQPSPPSNTRETFLEPSASNPPPTWWPGCARAEPTVTRASSADWITLNYDFGCVHVSIGADVAEPDASSIRSETLERNAERLGDRVSAVDEAGDPQKITSVAWDIKRNGVPNTVSIDCIGEGRTFCQDRAAQATLIARLSIVGGSRQP